MVDISEQSSLLPRPNLHVSLEQIPRDDEVLNLVRPLVDARHTQIAVPALNRHLAGVAHAAVYLHHAINYAVRHACAIELRYACLVAIIQALIDLPRRV